MSKLYKGLSQEWGSKARKQEARAKKSTLRKPTKEELAEGYSPEDVKVTEEVVRRLYAEEEE